MIPLKIEYVYDNFSGEYRMNIVQQDERLRGLELLYTSPRTELQILSRDRPEVRLHANKIFLKGRWVDQDVRIASFDVPFSLKEATRINQTIREFNHKLMKGEIV